MINEITDTGVIAAIIAAITEYEGNGLFEIKSVSRLDQSKWNKAGREDLMRGNESIYLRRRRPL